MSLLQIFLIGVSLSMDAFAVALAKGACMRKLDIRQCLLIAFFFGAFQALMPTVGWLIGSQFRLFIEAFDHWVAFVLLAIIGGMMIRESFEKEEEEDVCTILTIKELFVLAVATSIDALAVGVVFAIEKVEILLPAALIGATTFALSLLGSLLGNRAGEKFRNKAQLAGGVVLVLIGAKILTEHLGVLA